jgi:tRNA1(Val) A37 N6-methylase TrmN6
MEPFLLASWSLEPCLPASAADLGCGSGIMALLLARMGVSVTGYDVRPEWIDLARRSAVQSASPATFVLADVRSVQAAAADLALLNPPYQAVGCGPASPDPWKAAARTELNGTLAELIAAGARLGRRLCVVLPQARADEGEAALCAAGLHLARRCDLDDSLSLLEGDRGEGPCRWERASLRVGGGWSERALGLYARLGARLLPPTT